MKWLLAFLVFLPLSILHASTMDQIAEAYVKLVLALGQHDPDYVDAYYGPREWQSAVEKEKKPLEVILSESKLLIQQLNAIDHSMLQDEMLNLRHEYLTKQLSALAVRVEMLQGKRYTFDEESALLYDAVAPRYDADHFKSILKELDALLPGNGNIQQRYEEYRKAFIIPPDRLDTVFTTAIQECRRRTLDRIPLPEGESFIVEYVTKKPWGGYNWYKGNSHSVIQVNTDLPSYIDRAIDLAAHEGYPGHHVYNVLLEDQLARKRGCVEFTAYALFSPQSLIAEGSANYGKDIVMTRDERLTFERTVLFPLAGLDTSQVERYYTVMELAGKLAFAGNEASRGYLDGKMSRGEAVRWLQEYSLMSRDRAEKRIDFTEKYRSYVINYNLGQELVREYVEGQSTAAEGRWEVFARLLSSPRLPSGLGVK